MSLKQSKYRGSICYNNIFPFLKWRHLNMQIMETMMTAAAATAFRSIWVIN